MRPLFAALGLAAVLAVGHAGTALAQDKKGTAVELAGLKATTPADWKEESLPPGSMRMNTFKLPKADGDADDADLALFFFRGGAGTVDQNLKRQTAKFTPAAGKDKVTEAVSKTKVGTFDAVYQDVAGTFLKKPFPMPESISSCGDLMAPAHSTTPRSAVTWNSWPRCTNRAPVQRPRAMSRPTQCAPVNSRTGCAPSRNAGCRKARAAFTRTPSRWVT